ncbi:hypothetical protein ACQ4LE_001851 [Meloidogyne hapla]
MAIFYQLTSALLIISMAFIAINEGMNTGNRSGTKDASGSNPGSCKVVHKGKLVDPAQLKYELRPIPSVKDKPNTIEVTSKDPNNKNFEKTKVTLVIGIVKCEASIKDKEPVECKIPHKDIKEKQDGKLIFSYSEGKEVEVPFKKIQMFNANNCEIQLDTYDIKSHTLEFFVNGYKLKVVPEEEKKAEKECKGKN